MNDVANVLARFEAIDWNAIDINAAYQFYEAVKRPHDQRALLVAPIEPDKRETWRLQCVADLQAMQGRSCPECAA